MRDIAGASWLFESKSGNAQSGAGKARKMEEKVHSYINLVLSDFKRTRVVFDKMECTVKTDHGETETSVFEAYGDGAHVRMVFNGHEKCDVAYHNLQLDEFVVKCEKVVFFLNGVETMCLAR